MEEIKLNLNEDQRAFFDSLKSNKNALLIPLNKWMECIHPELGSNKVRDPDFRIAGAYVISELDAFELLAKMIKHRIIYSRPEGITTKEYGTFRFAGKLELRRVMPPAPNHDIFDVGDRQPGSFRSK